MEDPTTFSLSHPDMRSPSLPVNPPYGQSLSGVPTNFSSNGESPAYYRHVPKSVDYGQPCGLDTSIPSQSMNATASIDSAVPFGMSSVPSESSLPPTGMPFQHSMPTNGYVPRPISMQSIHGQENLLGSPMQGIQGTTNAMHPTAYSTQKRTAEGSTGPFGYEVAEGFSKRPRLNVSIHAMQMDSPSAQTSPRTIQPNMRTAMTPIDSAGDQSAFRAATPISRSNSMVMTGQQSTPMTMYSAQMQDPSFMHQHSFRTPSVASIPSRSDLQRPGEFSTSHQDVPLAATPFDRKLSSTASSAGFPPSAHPYSIKAMPEGFSPFHPLRQPLTTAVLQQGHVNDGRFTLVVKQQPERARLCSFKEENDTSMFRRKLIMAVRLTLYS